MICDDYEGWLDESLEEKLDQILGGYPRRECECGSKAPLGPVHSDWCPSWVETPYGGGKERDE